MTQKQFWADIEARTSKEVADFGFESVDEECLPGCSYYWDENDVDSVDCTDLDAATANYPDHRAGREEKRTEK